MRNNDPRSDKIAIFAALALGGLLSVPRGFEMYGEGGALGGAKFLAILISCQLAFYAVILLTVGTVRAIRKAVYRLFHWK